MQLIRRLLATAILCSLLLSGSGFAYEELWDTAEGRERIFNALVDIFKDNYWDTSLRDWDTWANAYRQEALEAESRADFDHTLWEMVNTLEDDHSRWVGLSENSNEAQASTMGPPGLGLRNSHLPETGMIIERVFPQTPAALAELERGDVIIYVNGQDVRGLSSSEANRTLATAISKGEVTLGIQRKVERLDIQIEPGPVSFSTVQDLPQGKMLDKTTGYIYIPSFRSDDVAKEVHHLLANLQAQGARSLVLDLRDNLGGQLGELGLILGAFIEGPWVEALSRDEIIWRSSYYFDNTQGFNVLETPEGKIFASSHLKEAVRFSGPVAVIVSDQNSSAGEVAALVLQESQRATIVGEPTSGNVEAIQGFTLPDDSLVYVAVANLQGISGRDYSLGVIPNIISSERLVDLARGYDAPVAEALRTLKALPFTPGKFF